MLPQGIALALSTQLVSSVHRAHTCKKYKWQGQLVQISCSLHWPGDPCSSALLRDGMHLFYACLNTIRCGKEPAKEKSLSCQPTILKWHLSWDDRVLLSFAKYASSIILSHIVCRVGTRLIEEPKHAVKLMCSVWPTTFGVWLNKKLHFPNYNFSHCLALGGSFIKRNMPASGSSHVVATHGVNKQRGVSLPCDQPVARSSSLINKLELPSCLVGVRSGMCRPTSHAWLHILPPRADASSRSFSFSANCCHSRHLQQSTGHTLTYVPFYKGPPLHTTETLKSKRNPGYFASAFKCLC